MFIIKLTFKNPNTTVRYLGEMNNCNTPKAKAKRFTKEDAEQIVKWPMLKSMNPEMIAA